MHGYLMGLQPEGKDLMARLFYRRHSLFAPLFSLCCYAMFCSPVITGIHLAQSFSVQYWIGWWSWLILLVPIILVGCHVYLTWHGRPAFYAVILSTIVPALIIIALGAVQFGPVTDISEKLLSSDCSSYDPKVKLNEAYMAAESVYLTCLQRVSDGTQMSMSDATDVISIEDCTEYHAEANKKYQSEWKYLKYLQLYQGCKGWCNPVSIAPWSRSSASTGVCTRTASIALHAQVRTAGLRMLVVGITMFLISVVIVLGIQEALVGYGLEW